METFLSVTGIEVEEAKQYLEMAAGNVERALELYFSTSTSNNEVESKQVVSAENNVQVRAPQPIKSDVLYEHDAGVKQHFEQQQNVAFRNFRTECSTSREEDALAALFEPPKDMTFVGTFDAAKDTALNQSRWLLVNIQSLDEFSSHQLNRDTWSDEVVKSTIQSNFVFWQVYGVSEGGSKFCSFYKIRAHPVILVLDPLTGRKMWSKEGFVDPQTLLEDLLPFMDAVPNEFCTPPALKRKASNPARKLEKRSLEYNEAHGDVDVDAQGGEGQVQLARATAQSHGETTRRERIGSSQEDMSLSTSDCPMPPTIQVEAEPPAGDRDALCVVIKLCDGTRKKRLFRKTSSLKAIKDYCSAQVPEAGMGRPFKLLFQVPGSKPLDNISQTLEEAQVANQVLLMSWS